MTLRQGLTYVEIDIDWCSLSYGIGACPAVLGVDSAVKCFNTIATCPVRASFDPAPVTLRFAKAAAYRPTAIEAIPSIVSVDFTPARLAPGEHLGDRASLRISFRDQPHSDVGPGFDKYHAERPYNPFEQGSFWSKFRARQPYLRGEPIRWINGFVGDDLADMETRHFLVESFNGPTPDGVYTLVAKDPLKLADGDRSNAPRASNGILNATINSAVTTAVLAPAGIGAAEYPAAGWINIGGKEIVAFTRATDTLTITRAQKNTTAVTHDAGERMQLCLDYAGQDPADIIYDLFVNYAGFEPTWCDLPAWQEEIAAFLRRDYTRHICEPTSVNQLVSELMQQAGLSVWWDDLARQVRLQVLRQISTDAAVYDDRVVVANTLQVKEQPGLRVSQVWCFYAQTNPLKGEDKDNFRSLQVTVDTENEEDYGQPAIKKIWATWIPFGGSSAAARVCDLQIGRFGRPPREFALGLFRDAQAAPQLGGGYQLSARVLQDATGGRELVPVQVIEVKPDDSGWSPTALEMRYLSQTSDEIANKTITIDVNTADVNGRTLHDSLFPDPVAGDQVTFIVSEGVLVRASSTAVPAFDLGSWPTVAQNGTRSILPSPSPIITGLASTAGMAPGQGVVGTGIPNGTKILTVDSGTQITLDQNATAGGTSTVTVTTVILNLRLRGRLQGAGGNGGRGQSINPVRTPQNGNAGGPALKVRHPLNLLLDEGEGKSFGGGGGGGGADVLNLDGHFGGGGAGGAG